MKKKFILSIICALMCCLTVLVGFGCKSKSDKTVTLSQAEALSVIDQARSGLKEEGKIVITCMSQGNEGFEVLGIWMLDKENKKVYMYSEDYEEWYIKTNNSWYSYFYSKTDETKTSSGEPDITYNKLFDRFVVDMSSITTDEDILSYEITGKQKGNDYEIIFSVNEVTSSGNRMVTYTFNIVDNKLASILYRNDNYTSVMTFDTNSVFVVPDKNW